MSASFGRAAKFLGWWAGLFGFIAAGGSSVCPCCGSTGCPVAPVTAGVLGGVVAILLFMPRWLIRVVKRTGRRVEGRAAEAGPAVRRTDDA